MKDDPAKLQQTLEYRFKNNDLLDEALTHRSAQGRNNERLEFLGDSILNFVIAAELFERCPEAPEGVLSRRRANLVNRSSLAELARELQLGHYVKLGGGEMKSGGHRRDSILSDTMEAVLGAVFLDGGYEPAKQLIQRLYQPRLKDLATATELKDPKTRLQEYLQARRIPLPSYRVLTITGKAHNQVFRVECCVEGSGVTTEGTGGSRRQAEQQAAEQMLQQLTDA